MVSVLEKGVVIDTVEELAEDIARVSPDCAEKATKIVELLQDLKFEPDRGTVQDVIDAHLVDTTASDARVQATTDAVISALKDRA